MRGRSDTTDSILASIAGDQHGVVARPQALAAGVSARMLEGRLEKGSLIGIHPGVYRVGHVAPSVEATYLAAVFACGEGAVLSGRAAARLLGLIRALPAPRPEVTAAKRRRVRGVVTRRSCVSLDDKTVFAGVPVTSPGRTIVDVAAVVSVGELGRLMHEAGIRFGTTPDDIRTALGRRPNAAGSAALRGLLDGHAKLTLSTLERRFLRLLRRARLPLPETNQIAGGRLIDCRWPALRLTVELDGYRFHASRHAWERDRLREREAYGRGDQFRRYTWGDVVERPAVVLSELRPLLTEAASL